MLQAALLDMREKLLDDQEKLLSHLQQVESDISEFSFHLKKMSAEVTTAQEQHAILKARIELLRCCKIFLSER